MGDDPATVGRRSLARVVEAALHFFGVANEEQFDCLLDNAEQRALLRGWLRSVHCRRDAAAGVADNDTQTSAGDTAASMEVGSAARLEIQLLRTELAAAESAAAQWFQRSALSTTTCVLSSRGSQNQNAAGPGLMP